MDCPLFFDELRPIFLCNCIYKISAKILFNRIRGILSKVVSSEQFDFLKKRQIHDAIWIAREVVHLVKTKKLLAVVIKVDYI